ncbi:unnamed protein product, partial [Symbiodinium microadriaticum]
ASVREVLGEQLKALQAQQGNVFAGKPEGAERLVFWSLWRGLKVLLLVQGYLGRGVGTPPRFKELKEKLEELAAVVLSPISSRVRCVRDWVNSMFSVDQRHSAHYVLIWRRWSISRLKREARRKRGSCIIAQDDTCEVALRRLAAWIHERRTGDKDAAQSMLAIKPSSFSSDVAPSWLVTEAASYSQSEHKRRERARAQAGGHHGGGNSKGGEPKSGKGKGKDKKKGGGKAANRLQFGLSKELLPKMPTQLQAEIEEQFAFVGGMTGAGALSRLHLERPGLQAAVCDQSNAFTSVLVPEWMIPYQAVPPIPAGDVWELLPQALRGTVGLSDWVCPCYMRLPMGCSHSVHILMSINLRIIGMTLRSSSLLSRASLSGHVIEEEFVIEKRPIEGFFGCSDAEWWKRFHARGADRREAGFSVEEWWRAIRKARLSSKRIFVIMHLFGGERCSEDVQAFVERFAEEAGISVLMATIDLATDYRWDLAREDTQHELLGMMSGFVDLLLLGPPCSTVSRARHLRNSVGIRPVRLRSCFWGRPGLKVHEQARVEEANTLYKHSVALCDRISLYGGGFLWEHPKDPGEHPFPSIFATVEFKELLCRTEASSVSFDQCVLGGPTQKPTTLAGNCGGLEAFAHCRCPGVDGLHSHERSLGFDGEGHFLTRRLQTYPPGMCSLIAKGLIDTCVSWQEAQGVA